MSYSDSVSVKYDAVVLGAGVIGLSIAHSLVDRGYKVIVKAKDLPEDLYSTGFASPWAGADWSASLATNDRERRRDLYTYNQFKRLAIGRPELCEKREFRHYWSDVNEMGSDDQFAGEIEGYRSLSPEEIPHPYKYGSTYQSFTLNTPLYLAYLSTTLREKGVHIYKERVSSLDEGYSYVLPTGVNGKVNLVVNATGLGSRSLLGVQDPFVFPAKGQTVLVKAPQVTKYYGIKSPHSVIGQKRYIIPRPGKDGNVILGGCYLPNDWSTNPDPIVAEQILKDAHDIAPHLDGKEGKGSWQDIKVISHNVGHRPVREGGLRLELESRKIGDASSLQKEATQGVQVQGLLPTMVKDGGDFGRQVAVLHAYGIGASGYQSSLGIASEAADLVNKWFKGKETTSNGH